MNGTLKSIQVFIGILIGLLGLSGIAAGVGYYLFITQISTHPPKPVFAEEREGSKTAIIPQNSQLVGTDASIPKLAPEAYDAKVIWKDGLSLRKDPDSSSEKVGSLAFDAKVAVIKTSDDKIWTLVQPETENIQGWVKANNIEKITGSDNKEQAAPKKRTKKAVDENNQNAPKRTKGKPIVTPEPSVDEENNQEEAAPKQRTKGKPIVTPEPSADENNQEQAAPKQRTKRRVKAAPEPTVDPLTGDGESSN
jgi:uncharacterized protein YgiM (DUF1202 family)